MATTIWIVKGPNRLATATLRRKGIKLWSHTYQPTSLALLQTGPATAGSVVGGAVVGGLLLGGVGAVVGGMAGGKRGRASFVVETAEGVRLTCQCLAADFAGVYAAISAMIERTRPKATEIAATAREVPVPVPIKRKSGGPVGLIVRFLGWAVLGVVVLGVAAAIIKGVS